MLVCSHDSSLVAMLFVFVCDSCSVFLYDVRLNQLVAKVFNGDVTESDSRPVSDICTGCIVFVL